MAILAYNVAHNQDYVDAYNNMAIQAWFRKDYFMAGMFYGKGNKLEICWKEAPDTCRSRF